MKRSFAGILVLPLFAGCGFAYGAGGVVHEDVYYEDASYGGAYFDHEYAYRVDYRHLPVSRRHLPPPGRCRVWLPGVHPRNQARHGSCRSLERRVPGGAWLLYRPRDYPQAVQLVHYDPYRRDFRTQYCYDVRTGYRVNPWW